MKSADFAVVGLIRATAAAMFRRAGVAPILADPHQFDAPDFRAEKLGEIQLAPSAPRLGAPQANP